MSLGFVYDDLSAQCDVLQEPSCCLKGEPTWVSILTLHNVLSFTYMLTPQLFVIYFVFSTYIFPKCIYLYMSHGCVKFCYVPQNW